MVMTDYTVFLEKVFRGPMDLLLHLVRDQEVEIHEVEITKVIEGYTKYLDALIELDIELAGEFTVMAATLMAIKSRSLLPREEISLEDELDPKDELIQRLLEYRRFKEASDALAKGLETRQKLHPRGAFPELKEERDAGEEPVLDLGDLTSWDLLATFSRLMRETLANQPMQLQGETRPMRYYVTNLANTIRRSGRLSLSDLITSVDGSLTRESLVGAFCALLELVNIGLVVAAQGERRGEIDVILAEGAVENFDDLISGTTFDDEMQEEVFEEAPDPQEGAPAEAESTASEPSS
ncbi:MAG: segregation and condensation protein A [Candidatus Paceibacteria bacterium]|jgi:segregation and condensation protein A